jgi:hypothetical protein
VGGCLAKLSCPALHCVTPSLPIIGLSLQHPTPACNSDKVPCSCHCCCRGRQVALDIAEALDYLHTELQVLHGDLKPG